MWSAPISHCAPPARGALFRESHRGALKPAGALGGPRGSLPGGLSIFVF